MATYGSVDQSSISDRGKICSLTTCQVLTSGAAAFRTEANRGELEANNLPQSGVQITGACSLASYMLSCRSAAVQ